MGANRVTVTARNPAAPRRTWHGLFLLATGAIESLVPGRFLRKIGRVPRGKRAFRREEDRDGKTTERVSQTVQI